MKFPDWAPTVLIDLYLENRRRHELDQSADEIEWRAWLEEHSDSASSLGFCTEGMAKQREHAAKLLGTLERLLTSPDMELAWASMSKATPTCEPCFHDELPWQLWFNIADRLGKFQQANQQTAGEKNRRLSKLAKMAKELVREIKSDPTASTLASHAVQFEMHRLNIEHRESCGEKLFISERSQPLTLSTDLIFATQRRENIFSSQPWAKRSLFSRLFFWAENAQRIGLTTLLERFAKAAENAAKQPPLVKQPGRGDTALKAYLVRELHDLMMWMYGQPLDDTVARIVNTTLNLWDSDKPLDRRSVRDYTDS